eukprot:2361685-Pleurochrysis_carterae.AAC.1
MRQRERASALVSMCTCTRVRPAFPIKKQGPQAGKYMALFTRLHQLVDVGQRFVQRRLAPDRLQS